jgi:hypothetical protein
MLAIHYMGGGHCIEDHPPIDSGWYYWTGSMFCDLDSEPIAWFDVAPIPEELKHPWSYKEDKANE